MPEFLEQKFLIKGSVNASFLINVSVLLGSPISVWVPLINLLFEVVTCFWSASSIELIISLVSFLV